MATLNRVQLDLIWLHVDMTNPRANDVLIAAQTRLTQRIPSATLSVNRNLAETQALIKVTGTPQDFTATLPGPVRAAIIRTFTEADHDEAVAMVTAVEWTGVIEV